MPLTIQRGKLTDFAQRNGFVYSDCHQTGMRYDIETKFSVLPYGDLLDAMFFVRCDYSGRSYRLDHHRSSFRQRMQQKNPPTDNDAAEYYQRINALIQHKLADTVSDEKTDREIDAELSDTDYIEMIMPEMEFHYSIITRKPEGAEDLNVYKIIDYITMYPIYPPHHAHAGFLVILQNAKNQKLSLVVSKACAKGGKRTLSVFLPSYGFLNKTYESDSKLFNPDLCKIMDLVCMHTEKHGSSFAGRITSATIITDSL